MGESVGSAIARALTSAYGTISEPCETPTDNRIGGPLDDTRNGPRSPSRQTEARVPAVVKTLPVVETCNLNELDVARLDVNKMDYAQAQTLFRLSMLLRAQCEHYEMRLKKYAEHESPDAMC